MNRLQALILLLASLVAGMFIANQVMQWFGRYIMRLFRERRLCFEVDSPLTAVAGRLRALADDDFTRSRSRKKYRVRLLSEGGFAFERAPSWRETWAPSVEGWLSASEDKTIVHANVQLSWSSVTSALSGIPAIWIMYLVGLFPSLQQISTTWLFLCLFVALPAILFGLLRAAMFLNEEKWQQDVDAFHRLVCGAGNEA